MTVHFRHTLPICLLFVIVSTPVSAQYEPPPTAETPVSSDLSTHLRTLAHSPHDLNALIGAGQSALSVGDATAALSFFGRANAVAPNDGRVKAGLGSTLLLMERPDDALRLFAEAVALGVPQASIAVDRGLAYDLRGDQPSAQRDYRLGLQTAPTDELYRRYALSLGISGQKTGALALLDPLLRKQDQAAWRDRAFILAMTGDVRGANSIARSIMPQQADAMAPFLKRLVNFTPSQRALAVTYGTMPEDARAPIVVPPSVIAPVQVAIAKPQASLTPAPSLTLRPRYETAAPIPVPKPVQPTVVALAKPVPPPAPVFVPVPKPTPAPVIAPVTLPKPAPTPVAVAAATPAVPAPPAATIHAPVTAPLPAPAPVAAPVASSIVTPPLVSTPVVPKTISVPPPQPIERPVLAQGTPPATVLTSVTTPVSSPVPTSAPATAPAPTPVPVQVAAAITAPKPVEMSVTPPAAVTAKTTFSFANLLDDVKPEEQTPAAHVLTDRELRAARLVAKKKADEKARIEAEAKAKADAKKAEDEEKRAESRKNPAREWVQVAGGNNRKGFATTWAGLKDDHAALKGFSAYYTPLNHTYRILVGPFDDADDARALAKKLNRDGLVSFTFSSEAGQEVTRIGGKSSSAKEDTASAEKPKSKKHKSRKSEDTSDQSDTKTTKHKTSKSDTSDSSDVKPARKHKKR